MTRDQIARRVASWQTLLHLAETSGEGDNAYLRHCRDKLTQWQNTQPSA